MAEMTIPCANMPNGMPIQCASERFAVGDNVTVIADYESHGDAAKGPLRPGMIGVIVKDNHSELPFEVDGGDRTWWYKADALKKVDGLTPPRESHKASPPPATVLRKLEPSAYSGRHD